MSVYAFGRFTLEASERRLTRDGRRVAVPGKAWQILVTLVEAGGRLVSHEALRAKLWSNITVEDRTLTVHVSTLRKVLGADAGIIETVARTGYRLAVPVRVPSGTGGPTLAAVARPEVGKIAVTPFATPGLADAETYLGACLRIRFSKVGESDSVFGDEQAVSPVEDR